MRPALFALATLLVACAATAPAESYALLDLNDQAPCPVYDSCAFTADPVVLPQATLTGGYVESQGTYNSYGDMGEEEYDDGQPVYGGPREINIKPAANFPVSEIRFSLLTAPSPASDIDIDALNSSGILQSSAVFPCDVYVCNYLVDLKFASSPYQINLTDVGDDFAWAFNINTIELNPALAPTAVTPEPPGMLFAATGAAVAWLFAASRRRPRSV